MKKQSQVKIGVILAGGRGTRLGWLGNFLPKSLIPVGQKPMIYYIIRNLHSIGIKKIYILINYKGKLIRDYLKNEPDFKKASFQFIHSQPNLGLAEVISKTEKYIREPFIVILGDDFTLSSQINKLPITKSPKTIVKQAIILEKNRKILSQTCEIYFNKKGQITRAVEKPIKPKASYRGCGLYYFKPQIFDFIKKTAQSDRTGKKEITDTINLVGKEKKASVWLINGINVNINTQDDLTEATKQLFLNGNKYFS